MVVEVGYSESEADLHRDATDWLLETSGVVKSVLLIKFCKPQLRDLGNWEKWIGWIEVWVPSTEAW
jgi:hypothetical protein